MDHVKCLECGTDLGEIGRREAFISVFVYGDEETRSWFRCAACGLWTVELYYDRFMGDSEVSFQGPIGEEAGRKEVERIRRCPDPGNKWCECEVHRELGR